MPKILLPGEKELVKSPTTTPRRLVTEFKVRYPETSRFAKIVTNNPERIVTMKGRAKKIRRWAAQNNAIILSAATCLEGYTFGTPKWIDLVDQLWSDTSMIPNGRKFIDGIHEEDFDRFYDAYCTYLHHIDAFKEWLWGQELYPGDRFEVNAKDLLYNLPIAAKIMFCYQLGYRVGTYEFQPKNHKYDYYEHYIMFQRGR